MSDMMRYVCLWLGLLFFGTSSALAGEAFFLPGVMHVHSTFSSGEDSLEEVVGKARAQGLRVIVLTDNYILRWEYGAFPLRRLVRKVVTMPSVERAGIEKFLQTVREVQQKNPDLILIPGVETIPFYYWQGSPWGGDLTLIDGQKNLLLVGMERAEDYVEMPIIGNPSFYHYTRQSLGQLWPLLFLGMGFWLIRKPRIREIQLRHFRIRAKGSYGVYGWPLIILAVLFLVDRFPFTTPSFSPYQGSAGFSPYQQLLDYVQARHGLSFWSMPETQDFHQYAFGRLGTVTVKTDPHPEALANTSGYTGFGAIYQENSTLTKPGGEWDQLLLAYCRGEREQPQWGIGEITFHGNSQAGKELYHVQTIFAVQEATPTAVLAALRAGHMYALQREQAEALVLRDFTLVTPTAAEPARMGETLRLHDSPLVHLRLESESQSALQFSLTLIRSGEVLATLSGLTPQDFTYSDDSLREGRGYYRVEVRGPTPHWLVSNPIFVEKTAP
ncbi:MAG: hypothetical protein HY268_26300 [Deltaproteobacteria bacterium]|nr:hypothetical protein [Deltaproteobacteria bacterium]